MIAKKNVMYAVVVIVCVIAVLVGYKVLLSGPANANDIDNSIDLTAEVEYPKATLNEEEYPYIVDFSLGYTETNSIDQIKIDKVYGDHEVFKLKGSYLITGTYKLASFEKAVLAVNNIPRENTSIVSLQKSQIKVICRGSGEFALPLTIEHEGHLYINIFPMTNNASFDQSLVYFGSGEYLSR